MRVPFSLLCLLGASVLTCGCGINTDVEDLITIETGVYGQTTTYDDVGRNNHVKYYEMTLTVRSQPDAAVVATVTSGKRGFYEAPLAPGSYSICTSFERCTDFAVADGECVRLDYEFGPGPGWAKLDSIYCPR